MKRVLLFVALAVIGCAGSEPTPNTSHGGYVPPNRCPFGNASYPNGERVCDHGRELECRDRMKLSEPGWFPTGKACEPGEPPATSS
jgi:hypothetical protein